MSWNGMLLRRALLSGCAFGVLVAVTPIAAFAAPPTAFAIPSEDLGAALRAFANQSGRDVVFDPALVAGKTSPSVQGHVGEEEALRQLLAGSGLSYVATSSGGYVVRGGEPKKAGAALEDGAAGLAGTETVVVTGTSIRGLQDSTSPIITFDRDSIDRTGYTDTADFIRSIPQNFGGGATGASPDGKLGPGFGAGANNEGASAANLRGLGTSSTLTLLDGHRMAASAYGGIVDISVIPLAAIDRVDVLTDGASAIYGSDAVGGVINFILRKDYEGEETRVSYGTVTDGTLNQEIVGQTFGRDWGSGNILVSVQYNNQSNLPASQRSFSAGALEPTDLLPSNVRWNGLVSARQSIMPNLDVFADALLSHSDLRNDTAYSADYSISGVSHNDAVNLHAGIGYEPFGDWRIELSGTFSRQHDDLILPSGDPDEPTYVPGTLDGTTTDTVASGDLKADGTLFSLPGGDVKAAVGGEFRSDDFTSYLPVAALERDAHRHIGAVFGELNVPIVGTPNAVPLVQRLELSAAVRYDHYSDFGGTTNPKIGILWQPVSDLVLRGTWGTSFRAPDASEILNAALGQSFYNYAFAAPNGSLVPVFMLQGIDPNLGPEKARTWNAGTTWTPGFLDGAQFGLNYYNISYTDRITTPPFVDFLTAPALYGALVTPLADDAAAAAYAANLRAQGYKYYEVLGTGSVGVRYVYDDRTRNAALVHQDGVDLTGAYNFKLEGEAFLAQVNATWINEIDTAYVQGASSANVVNTYGSPLHYRGRADLLWMHGPLTVDAAVNYANPYRDTTTSPEGVIGNYTTVDLTLRLTPKDWTDGTLLEGTTVGLSVSNLFDQDPPYVASPAFEAVHYDAGTADPRGRFITVQIVKAW